MSGFEKPPRRPPGVNKVVLGVSKGGFLSRRVRQEKVAGCDSAMLQGAT